MNSQRDKIIFHIDVNSAFLSWEAVDRLKHGSEIDLRTIPSVVGGDEQSRKGVVLAKSTPAKAFGINTGEPLFQTRKKCPQITVVPARHELYAISSDKFFEVLEQYSPLVSRYSIDEGFLDYTGMENLFGEPIKAAYLLKDRIHKELGFTVNIGISTNRLLAKMAGELSKPDKVHTIWPEEITTKMWPLPIKELFMAGRSSVGVLHGLGIKTIGDLAQSDVTLLERHLKKQGRMLWNYANGHEDPLILAGERVTKGISNSCTTSQDIVDLETAQKYLLSLTENVAFRLRQEKLLCNNVSVALKDCNFKTSSHQKQLNTSTDITTEIYSIVKLLFEKMWNGQPIRLFEVRVSQLSDETETVTQLSLFDPPNDQKSKNLDQVIDQIRQINGQEAIVRASLLSKNRNNT